MNYYINAAALQVVSDGDLPRGYYTYRVAVILKGKELDLANMLRIFAPHRGNTIGIAWDEVPGAEAYRVYRRANDELEGSILIDSPAFFYDNGLIEFA